MDIVIIAQYMRDISKVKTTNSRFWYIASLLYEAGNNVEIITSDFNHEAKKHFDRITHIDGITITMCHEEGYPRNVCLKRFKSHKRLAKEIEKYLNTRKKPDVVYTAIPSLDVAEVCSKYCTKNNIRFVIDIQDLWPEAFKMVVNVPVISDIAFAPMKHQANHIYEVADEIIAVSKTYAKRAARVNKKNAAQHVVYLGTDKSAFLDVDRKQRNTNYFTIGYVGRLSDSYDLNTVIDAISGMNEKIKLLVMGDGPLRDVFENRAKRANVNAVFTGMLPYPDMVKQLCKCDIAVNPIRKGSAGSIINKVSDYAMAGLPVVNTQECEEYRELLESYEAGINCRCENIEDVREALKVLMKDSALKDKMSRNSKKLGEELMDRGETYHSIVHLVIGE